MAGSGGAVPPYRRCSTPLDKLTESSERVEVLVDAPVASAHRVELDARHADLAKGFDAVLPLFRTALYRRKPSLHRDKDRIASCVLDEAAKRLHPGAAIVVRRKMREPTVRDLRDTPERGLDQRPLLPVPAASHPYGDRALHRKGVEAGPVDPMPSSVEVHDLLRPERPQNGDLLLDPLATIGEAHPERLVRDLVPSDADPKDKTAARQDVHLRRLFRDDRRLPLGQDEHRGGEPQPDRDRGEVAEQDERLVERRPVVVGAGPAPRPVGISAEHVVEDHEVVVPELLDGPRVRRDDVGISPDLKLRKHRADMHESQYRCERSSASSIIVRWRILSQLRRRSWRPLRRTTPKRPPRSALRTSPSSCRVATASSKAVKAPSNSFVWLRRSCAWCAKSRSSARR